MGDRKRLLAKQGARARVCSLPAMDQNLSSNGQSGGVCDALPNISPGWKRTLEFVPEVKKSQGPALPEGANIKILHAPGSTHGEQLCGVADRQH